MKFEYKDYPSIFKKADKLSIEAQNNFLNTIKIDMALLILASILSQFQVPIKFQKYQLVLIAFLMIVSLITSFFIHFTSFEGQWYGARAAAESFKSLTWKFMIGSAPFEITDAKSEENFLLMSQEVLSEKKSLLMTENLSETNGDAVTKRMREIRQLSLSARLNFYIDNRIEDQRIWYLNKSIENRKNKRKYFIFILLMQMLAILWAIFRVSSPDVVDLTQLFSAVVIALIGWNQIKKYNELSVSYNLASEELNIIKAKKSLIDSEKKLSSFVSNSENAISREHTMWVARRDNF